MAAQPHQTPRTGSGAPAFIEPRTLAEFNERLSTYNITPALSGVEFLLLTEQKSRVDLTRALIAMHGGGQNRERARTAVLGWIATARDALARGVRPQQPAPAPPREDRAPFNEPSTLGEVNAFLEQHTLCRRITKAELDNLLGVTGRVAMMTAFREIHDQGPRLEEATTEIRAAINAAIVRVQREAVKAPPANPADELPLDENTDHGYEGTWNHGRSPQPARQFADRSQSGDRGRPPHPSGSRDSRDQSRGRPDRAARDGHAPSGEREPSPHSEPHIGIDKPQARVYAGKAALCLEPTASKQRDPTIRIEMAPADPQRQKVYVWQKKLGFQLMRKELLEILAVLMGWAPRAEFKFHGPTKGKWLKIENQDGKVYISMGDKDVPTMGVPITEQDALLDMVALTIEQARLAFHGIASADMLRYVQTRVAPACGAPGNNGARSRPT